MKFVTLYIIASSEYEDKLKSVAKEAGASGATILQGRGSGASEKKSFFALTFDGNQTVLLYILEEKLSKRVLKALHNEIENNPTDCVAFTQPIGHIVGLNKELLQKFEDGIKNENDL